MATNTNRKDGLRFETELCEKLARCGWWAHDMTQNAAGQPADVIAVRINHAVLIDCKVCSTDKFPLSRIEPNQELAMGIWLEKGNQHAYFAVKYPSGKVYMCHYDDIRWLKKQKVSSIPEAFAQKCFHDLNFWIDWMEDEI